MKFFSYKDNAVKYTEDDLETYFHLNITLLWIINIFVGVNGDKSFKKFGILTELPIPTIMTIIFSVSCGILQFLQCFRVGSTDINTIAIIYTNIFSNISCVSKGSCLMYNRRKLQLLLDNVSKLWNDNRPKGKCRKGIIKLAKNTLFFVKVFIIMTIALEIAFGLPPLQYMLSQYAFRESLNYSYDYSMRIFLIEYPFDIDSPLKYWSVLCQEFWILFGLGFCWITGDTLFATLTTHLTIQFKILEDDVNSQIKEETDEANLKANLISLVHRHRTILSACDDVERIFSPIIFVNVIVSSMNICVNTFVIQEKVATGAFTEAGYNILLTMNTFLQMVVYCTFAETLTQTSTSISNAIYDCEWANKSQEIKMLIHILLMKTQNPFYCSAYGFFVLTHQQLTKIVNTSLSYYMMLRILLFLYFAIPIN